MSSARRLVGERKLIGVFDCVVDGKPVQLRLSLDHARIVNAIGAKAARSKNGYSKALKGAIKVELWS